MTVPGRRTTTGYNLASPSQPLDHTAGTRKPTTASFNRVGRMLPAMPAWFNAVWPIVTFALGLASTHFTSFITEKRQIAREAKARQAERDKVLVERRETFELDHLERLNEALHKLGRAVSRAHFVDTMTGRQTGEYASTQLPDEDSNAYLEANRDVYMLRNLILDDALRTHVAHAHELLNVPINMRRSNLGAAEDAYYQAVFALDDAQSAIAQRIRRIYMTATLPESIT
ncbi:hypothetical protein AB0G64_26845 [Streptomyces longwoodensis]|uniref:hypothetical protein n=1 Tax=Streptomyces longwoodensis TaxID=68231 RepID=UPI0033D12242